LFGVSLVTGLIADTHTEECRGRTGWHCPSNSGKATNLS
jgi:hypothetical protein